MFRFNVISKCARVQQGFIDPPDCNSNVSQPLNDSFKKDSADRTGPRFVSVQRQPTPCKSTEYPSIHVLLMDQAGW